MTPSSVLVVKPSSLGDIVHTLPAVHYLKTTFPDAEISWIANTEWVPLLEENADLKTVIPFPRASSSGVRSGSLNLSDGAGNYLSLKPDLVLDFQGLFRSAWISRSAKGKSVLGLSDSREASRFCYDRRALVQPGQHSVDRYLALARLAGADTSGPIAFPSSSRKTDFIARIAGSIRRPAPVCSRSPQIINAGRDLSSSPVCSFPFRWSSSGGPAHILGRIETESRW